MHPSPLSSPSKELVIFYPGCWPPSQCTPIRTQLIPSKSISASFPATLCLSCSSLQSWSTSCKTLANCCSSISHLFSCPTYSCNYCWLPTTPSPAIVNIRLTELDSSTYSLYGYLLLLDHRQSSAQKTHSIEVQYDS